MEKQTNEDGVKWTFGLVADLTKLILLIDQMSSSDINDPNLREAADILQQQLVYNGEVLDIALEGLKQYRPGTQSLAYLDSSVHLAYALLRMLESWAKNKGNETYVRQKKTQKRRRNKGSCNWFKLQAFPDYFFLQVFLKRKAYQTRKKSLKR